MKVFGPILWLSTFSSSCLAIWPKPSQSSYGSKTLLLASNFEIWESTSNSSTSPPYRKRRHAVYVQIAKYLQYFDAQTFSSRAKAAPRDTSITPLSILQSAIERAQAAVNTKLVPWKFHSRTTAFEPALNSSSAAISSLQINQPSAPNATGFDPTSFFSEDESYTLTISENGEAAINSNSVLGTLWALQTFQQLFYAHSSGSTIYTPYAPVSISDSPKWAHRGLNLDISRNVFSPQDVMRTIDAMTTAKMNRLHLHATDAQSWPLQIPALPTLSEKGAYQSYLAWSPDDLSEVQSYGIYRGINVFVEIDMPGHTASIANAFPNLITAYNETDWQTFAAEPPSGELKLNSPDVYSFLQTLFGDLFPRVSPYTTYFHTGGDEVNVNAYLLDETVKSNDSAVLQPLLQKFVSNAQSQARVAGLQPISWEEMILDWNLTLPNAANSSSGLDTIVQVWQDSSHLQSVVEKGYRALFGDYNNWYLDCGYGGFINPYASGVSPPGVPYGTDGGVPTVITAPYQDYCSPMKTWRQVYTYNPLANITEDLQYLIEGGEVHMWTEKVDPSSMDSVIWPRAASAAEVLWSGPQTPGGLVDATTRLAEWRERVVLDHNVRSGMVQMAWCLMEGGCDL